MKDSHKNDAEEGFALIPPDSRITRDLFLMWRSPRAGVSNPERMTNPVWEWLIQSKLNAYQANEHFNGPSAAEAGPCWCFDRFGQSTTQLSDGRIIYIAGEHEDHYDPDFHIYNDVVVQHPDGRLEIFGYPDDVFPPTDFHSATLVGDRIILIGNLGHAEQRRPGYTPVLVLDLKSFAISKVQTSGTPPGWIHGHAATLSKDGLSILIQRGELDRGEKDKALVENFDDWRLNLTDWRWERLTERRWPHFSVRRKDGQMNHFFDYQQAVWAKHIPALAEASSELAKFQEQFEIPSLQDYLGKAPDLELFARRYQPVVPHEPVPGSEDEFNVHRIKVEGVLVRYTEDSYSIKVVVEGDLPTALVEDLARDLVDKISLLENVPCEVIRH